MTHLSRRAALAGIGALGAVTLTGCGVDGLPFVGTDPDDEVRRGVARSEADLIASYDAAIAAEPTLSTGLQPIRDAHRAHLDALIAEQDDLRSVTGNAIGQPTVAALRRLERAAARQRADACVSAGHDTLVVLLARIGAAEAGHTAVLKQVSA